ncbi:D-xylose transport system substrate-binding protein [Crossiella equi]|uniref:D-xylose transport system substrate-binding protein n=1 Tax=Crossiella equi TaxID=130796 RepID=A0ABS5AAE4_9PSEU|nr:substrate-binding domain-containing protein [Crossiella equi]MBP2473550.1 D-xylose transport system substrate-binding protein [Crossiella equi]
MRSKTLGLIAVSSGLALALSACGANSTGGGGSTSAASGSEGSGPKVGVILPDTKTSARWEGFDKPLLEKALKDAGVTPLIQNAENDPGKFSTIADSFISQGVKVLMIARLSNEGGAAVQKKAKAAGIPTIDYDRLTLGGSADYYVSFDNTKVGELQGQGLVDCLKGKTNPNIVQINGGPEDYNATLFKNGAEKVLKPLYDNGSFKLAGDQWVQKWDNQLGNTIFEQELSRNGGKVDGVLAANDGLASAIITVLKKNGLNGKVPVTGQDADPAALANILRGDQCMTVFKPIAEEAANAAKIAIALAKGDKASADALATGIEKDPEGKRDVKSVLLSAQTITKANVKVVTDSGFVKPADFCKDDVAQLCKDAGISVG